VSELHRRVLHKPSLGRLKDGRWVVRCPQCRVTSDQMPPVGIDVPIVNRHEAEWIIGNHTGRAGNPTTRAEPGGGESILN
jgi:hypothetical protein